MMRRSLRGKLTALIAVGGVVASLIAAAGFAAFDFRRFWNFSQSQVGAIANIVHKMTPTAGSSRAIIRSPRFAGW